MTTTLPYDAYWYDEVEVEFYLHVTLTDDSETTSTAKTKIKWDYGSFSASGEDYEPLSAADLYSLGVPLFQNPPDQANYIV